MSSGDHVLEFVDGIFISERHHKESTRSEAESRSASVELGINCLTLDGLCEELDRCIKETQRLQEEVETETRKNFGCTSSAQTHHDDSSEGSGVPSAHQYLLTNPSHQERVLKEGCSLPMDEVDENLQSDLNEFSVSPGVGKERENPQREMMRLQEKLHEAQMENNFLSDLRLKDSRKHVDQMETMLQILEEVQDIKRSAGLKVCQSLWEEPSRTQQNLTDTDRSEDRASQEPESEDQRGLEQERFPELISSLVQEAALLTHRLSCSKESSDRLAIRMEQLRKLAERQTSLRRRQRSDLEAALARFREKVRFLEQRLSETRLQLLGSRTDRDRTLRCLEDLRVQLRRLKLLTLEYEGDARVWREQLEGIRKKEEKTSLQRSQELLQRKSQELQVLLHETQQCQTVQAEREALRLEDEKKPDPKLQTETAEHSRNRDRLQQQNGLFTKRLQQQKLQMQQLRVELLQQTSERERRRPQSQRTQEETLEQQQLQSLTKELEELQSWKDQHAGVVLQLQSQLRSAREELEKTRRALKALEGAECQGLQAAFSMQTEVTSRREQVDALQSRVRLLEEDVENLQQEKRLQKLELQRQLQKVSVFEEERRQLQEELRSLRSRDQQLKGRIGDLEAMLHKMFESFTSCRDFLQAREQDYFRLKLQHALDLKELQGQNLPTPPPDVDSVDSATSPAVAAPPSTLRASNSQNKPIRLQRRCSAGDPPGGASETCRTPREQGGAGSSSCRRRSAPGRENTTTHWVHSKQEVNFSSKLRRKTFLSDLHLLQTSELKQKEQSQNPAGSIPATAAKSSSFLHHLSLGRKSPVHSLLTSGPSS